MKITHVTDSYGQVTALLKDGNFLWIGYIAGGQARLRKVSIYDTSLLFYDGVINATKIIRIRTGSSADTYIQLVLDSATYIGAAISKNFPTSHTYAPKPTGVTQNAVDVAVYITPQSLAYAYYLIPGIEVSVPAKITRQYEATSGQPYEVADLTLGGTTLYTPSAMTLDENLHLWLVTYTDPVKLMQITLDETYGYITMSLIKNLG